MRLPRRRSAPAWSPDPVPGLGRQVRALVRFHATRGQPHSGGYDCAWCYPGGRLHRAWARVTELWARVRA